MKSGLAIPIGKVAGIPIYLDYSWFLIFFLLVYTIGFSLMPGAYPGLSEFEYLFIGVVTSLLFFGSLLLHELAHCIVAKRNGMTIRRITLFLLGGVSELEDEPKDAMVELSMAAAGPLTSLVIAAIFFVIWFVSTIAGLSVIIQAPVFYLALVNLIMAIFNFIPAYPMDGGRMLRALLWRRNGDIVRSTKVATEVGQTFAAIIMALGIFSMFFIDLLSGIWTLIIGWFISTSSSASLQQTMAEEDLRGVRAADVMTRNVDAVPPDMTLASLSDECVRTKHTGFPVTSNGKIMGCVTMGDLRRFGRDRWATMTVDQAMTPSNKLAMVTQNDPATDVLTMMQRRNVGRIFVADDGELQGIITRSDLVKAIELREGTMSLARRAVAFDSRVSMTVEPGMNFVLEQPVEKGFVWRPEFSGSDVQLIAQDLYAAPDGREEQRFIFQAARAGTYVIRLHEVQGTQKAPGSAKSKGLRTVTYTVVASASPTPLV
jgi:Zn-dependent protease/CBS domain-containing protein